MTRSEWHRQLSVYAAQERAVRIRRELILDPTAPCGKGARADMKAQIRRSLALMAIVREHAIPQLLP